LSGIDDHPLGATGKPPIRPGHALQHPPSFEWSAYPTATPDPAERRRRGEIQQDHPIRRDRRPTLKMLETKAFPRGQPTPLVGERGEERPIAQDDLPPL
jgi:hypothetical protein